MRRGVQTVLVAWVAAILCAQGPGSARGEPWAPAGFLAPPTAGADIAAMPSAVASLADTQWTANGRPVCAASYDQVLPSVASDGEAGAFVAWTDYRPIGPRVFMQRVLADGEIASGWPVDGLSVSDRAQDMQGPVSVADGNGGVYVVWANGTNHVYSVFAQHVDGTGNVVAGWPTGGLRVTTAPSNQYRPCATTDGGGGVYVVWEDDRNGADNPDLYIQRIGMDGTPAAGWDSSGTPLCMSPGYQYRAALCPDGSGGVIAVWVDGYQVSAMRMTSSGGPAFDWPVNGVIARSDTTYVQNAIVASDSAGGCFVSWIDNREGEISVFVQHLDSTGQSAVGWPSGGRPAGATGVIQQLHAISADGSGGLYVAWWEDAGLRATRLTSSGETPLPWPADGLLLSSAFMFLGYGTPVLFTDADQNLHVIWDEQRYLNPTGADLSSVCLTPDGAFAPGWPAGPRVFCNASGSQGSSAAVLDATGSTVAWQDQRNGNWDIYAARLTGDGIVPTLLALADVSARPEWVRLRWYAGSGAPVAATVYRRTPTSEWSRRAECEADGSGFFTYEDDDVLAGGRYAYRLGAANGAAEAFTEETWVDVPPWDALALAGACPNPTKGTLTVAFTLRNDAPATLVLLDVSGRRVAEREVGHLGAGRHRLPLFDTGQPASGVYWLRLTQGRETVTTRCAVIQ
jgi:hypothetical protein